MREIFARSRGAVSGTDWLPHLLQLDPHVVDVGIHSNQIDVFIGARSGVASDFSLIPVTRNIIP